MVAVPIGITILLEIERESHTAKVPDGKKCLITYAAAYSSVAEAVILCEIKLKVAAPVQASTNARDKYVSHLRVDDHAGETRFFC